MNRARIGVLGDYNANYGSHPETNAAIEAAARRAGIDVAYEWVATDTIEKRDPSLLDAFDGIWVSPGAPYRSLNGALEGIRHARESGQPLVGT
jgi:CTP synthase (UTP-ammonia lyase)